MHSEKTPTYMGRTCKRQHHHAAPGHLTFSLQLFVSLKVLFAADCTFSCYTTPPSGCQYSTEIFYTPQPNITFSTRYYFLPRMPFTKSPSGTSLISMSLNQPPFLRSPSSVHLTAPSASVTGSIQLLCSSSLEFTTSLSVSLRFIQVTKTCSTALYLFIDSFCFLPLLPAVQMTTWFARVLLPVWQHKKLITSLVCNDLRSLSIYCLFHLFA